MKGKRANKSVGLVILAGGNATRFPGKPFFPINGMPMIKRIYSELENIFDEIVISIKSKDDEPGFRRALGDVLCVEDRRDIETPLNGIISAFSSMKSDTVCIAPCDAPFIKRRVYIKLLGLLKGFDCAVPVVGDGRIEPLIAAYKRVPMLESSKKAIRKRRFAVRDAFDFMSVNYVDAGSIGDPEWFTNANYKNCIR